MHIPVSNLILLALQVLDDVGLSFLRQGGSRGGDIAIHVRRFSHWRKGRVSQIAGHHEYAPGAFERADSKGSNHPIEKCYCRFRGKKASSTTQQLAMTFAIGEDVESHGLRFGFLSFLLVWVSRPKETDHVKIVSYLIQQ